MTLALSPDRPLLQDPAFDAALRARGARTLRLGGGELVLLRRFAGLRLAMLPRAAPPPGLARALAEAGLARVPLILSPDHPCPLPPALCLQRPRDLILLDLPRENARARKALHPKWRNQLRLAEKRPIHIVEGPLAPDPEHPLLRMERRQARQRGYLNWPAPLTAAFAMAAPEQTLWLRAGVRDRVVAHMLFLIHGSRATYHIGQTSPEGRRLHAHNLLLWRASRQLASMGVRRIELGLVQPGAPGLNRFKLRTGARRQPTGGSWLYWRPLARGAPRPSCA